MKFKFLFPVIAFAMAIVLSSFTNYDTQTLGFYIDTEEGPKQQFVDCADDPLKPVCKIIDSAEEEVIVYDDATYSTPLRKI